MDQEIIDVHLFNRKNTYTFFFLILSFDSNFNFVRESKKIWGKHSISLVLKREECIDLFSMEFRDVSKGRILILCSAVKV